MKPGKDSGVWGHTVLPGFVQQVLFCMFVGSRAAFFAVFHYVTNPNQIRSMINT